MAPRFWDPFGGLIPLPYRRPKSHPLSTVFIGSSIGPSSAPLSLPVVGLRFSLPLSSRACHLGKFSRSRPTVWLRYRDDRIQTTIRRGCTDGLSAEALIDRLLAEVRSFCGEVAQEDDMTCVMVRVEE